MRRKQEPISETTSLDITLYAQSVKIISKLNDIVGASLLISFGDLDKQLKKV